MLLADWQVHLRARNISPATIDSYARIGWASAVSSSPTGLGAPATSRATTWIQDRHRCAGIAGQTERQTVAPQRLMPLRHRGGDSRCSGTVYCQLNRCSVVRPSCAAWMMPFPNAEHEPHVLRDELHVSRPV
jgi:hypothetical protein